MGSVHTLLNEEQAAFADWINDTMGSDKDVAHKLKIEETGDDMYNKMDDGVILCKMINLAAPDTIDERVINTGQKISIFKQHENLTLAINSAKVIILKRYIHLLYLINISSGYWLCCDWY